MHVNSSSRKHISVKWVVFWLLLAPFLYPFARSIFTTGIMYPFDNDEVLHTQFIYLINHGFLPYRDFFSNHSIVFHLAFTPLFEMFGYTIDSIHKAREVSVWLFLMRTGLTMVLTARLFNRTVAALFAPLFLTDPFMMFVGMQFRPDGMAVLFLVVSCILLTFHSKNRTPLSLFAGICMGFALLIQLKVLPLVLSVSVSYLYFIWRAGVPRHIVWYGVGLGAPMIIYAFIFTMMGYGNEMIQQMFFDSVALQRNLFGPLGFSYQPNNAWIYGLAGKPLTWVYAWCLPLLAAAGIGGYVYSQFRSRPWSLPTMIAMALGVGGVAQWLSLFAVGGVYLQYFIAHSWVFGLFAAFLVWSFVERVTKHAVVATMISLVCALLVIQLLRASTHANNARPTQISNEPFVREMHAMWEFVPPHAPVFPNILFRPLAYPLADGYIPDLGAYPSSIVENLPTYTEAFEKTQASHVIATDEEFHIYAQFDPTFSSYMREHFQRIENTSFWKRTK